MEAEVTSLELKDSTYVVKGKARHGISSGDIGMDFLTVLFSVSGVKTNILPPPLVAMVISFLTSMGGISGAFLLLPFQMSVLKRLGVTDKC